MTGGPTGVVIADLKNDRSQPDLAVISDQTLTLLSGNGDGTFTPFSPGTIALPGSGAAGIVAGLFNSDTNVDLAITLEASNQIVVLLGNGNGTFQAPELYNVGESPTGIVSAALAVPGRFDLAAVNTTAFVVENVSILFGNGDGTFEDDSPSDASEDSTALTAADLDQDGRIDLAVTNVSPGQSVAVLYNDPEAEEADDNGFVLLPNVPGSPGGGATAIQAGKLNADAYPDLVVLRLENFTPVGIAVMINTTGGGGTPTPSPTRTPTRTTATPTRPPTPAPRLCAGDCSYDGSVSVDDVVIMVMISSGTQALSVCPAADANQDRAVTIDDIIAAVFNVLHGCAQSPRCLPGGQLCTRSWDCCSGVCFTGTSSCW